MALYSTERDQDGPRSHWALSNIYWLTSYMPVTGTHTSISEHGLISHDFWSKNSTSSYNKSQRDSLFLNLIR